MKTLRQCNTRWGSKKLGTGTICDRGCTVTSISMLSGTTPDIIVNKADFTSSGAILWQSLSKANIRFEWRGYKYNNADVAQAIKDYGGCLVEVKLANSAGGKHWVLFVGDKKMHDPITGKIESTSKYGVPTGYCILEPLQTNNEPMSDPLKECLKQHDKLVTDAVRKDSKVEDLKETIKDKNEELATKEKQVSAQKGLVSASKKDVELCFAELTDARLQIVELEKGKPVEAIKDPLRYAISLGVGAILTWAYTKYPVLGQLQPDMQGLAVILIGLLVKGLDKYQHESGSSLKLPF